MPDQNSSDDSAKRELDLEERKLEVEKEKLAVERTKARWAAIAAIVPAVVAFGTISYGVWSLNETAKTQFETKLIEIAMQGQGPIEAINRAGLVAEMFGEYLPKDFVARLNKVDPESLGRLGDPTAAAKKELLKLLADHPTNQQKIITNWEALFPGDHWASALTNPSSAAANVVPSVCKIPNDPTSCISVFVPRKGKLDLK
jgi:hypothetical protein